MTETKGLAIFYPSSCPLNNDNISDNDIDHTDDDQSMF